MGYYQTQIHTESAHSTLHNLQYKYIHAPYEQFRKF